MHVGSFKNPFATNTILSELHFRFRKFILLVQTKKSDFHEPQQHGNNYKLCDEMGHSDLDLLES